MDLRGHSGGSMSLGKGSIITGSTKQKINTKSSTETELVAADDFMPMIRWTNYFLHAQGYDCSDTVLYQDNQSTILLEKNGRMSSSRSTKHLNIWYFFITDRINKGDYRLSTARPLTWLLTFLLNLWKVNCFSNSGIWLWITNNAHDMKGVCWISW